MGQHTSLGERMKEQYEFRTRMLLPRRTYTLLRIDGKAFHTYTRGREKPFDPTLTEAMVGATEAVMREAMGARMGYVQSDEASILLTDFTTIRTEAWFNGNVQKICSVAASVFTQVFADIESCNGFLNRRAFFDCRVFTIPDRTEVENYFIWRQDDAVRNSIQGLAQANFSHRELQGLSGDQLQEKLFQECGINWNDELDAVKRGTLIGQALGGGFLAGGAPDFVKTTDWRLAIPGYD